MVADKMGRGSSIAEGRHRGQSGTPGGGNVARAMTIGVLLWLHLEGILMPSGGHFFHFGGKT